jgi:protein-S-isoprenylcysteine O-methyltransferase Ste14
LHSAAGANSRGLNKKQISRTNRWNRATIGCVSIASQLRGGIVRLVYNNLFTVLWVAFLVYWYVMSMRVKATERLEPAASRALRGAALLGAIVLLSVPFHVAWLNYQLWPQGLITFWAGAVITAAGLMFCVWARVHLGRNWSSAVTIKEGHELIVTGPYALVRHPIYTGLMFGFLGTVLALAEVRGVLGFLLITLTHFYKLRLEEKWMRAQFGETYEAYSSRVAALVPYVL